MRLDIKISTENNLPRQRVKELIESGGVLLNGKPSMKASLKILETDIIEIIKVIEPQKTNLVSSEVSLDIIFEDDYFMIINKQAGVSTHPASINGTGTIANGVALLVEGTGLRPGIVHRLDKDTTGLLIIAKTDEALSKLSEMISERNIERKYLALCYGAPAFKSFQIKTNVIRDDKNRLKMRICRESGKEAVTNVLTKQSFLEKQFSLLELRLETGRTHQIRLHLEHHKNPVIGDLVYGLKPPSFFNKFRGNQELQQILLATKRQMLHAFSLKFAHPITEKEMHFEVNPPEDFQKLLEILKSSSVA
jgi:23S rRNA pseudouridine1911/1915/1917 synthase